jgi:hypothetical protein
VHFLHAAADFRGQQVPVGFYTLRYALIPDDGNHLGVSPNPDFLLLIPLSPIPTRVPLSSSKSWLR